MKSSAAVVLSVHRRVRVNRVNILKLSPMLHNAAVQEATSSKKGPHRQSSSVLGSQSDTDAASFQQLVLGIVSLMLECDADYRNRRLLTVHGPTAATLAPIWRLLIVGNRGVTGDATETATIPKTTTSDMEAFIFTSKRPESLICKVKAV
jgi:hypothetical protein